MGKDIAKYLIYFLLGIIFTISWITAKDAQCSVTSVKERVSVLEYQAKDIKEMKDDIKKLLIAVGVK